jgi:carboxyl-terminal processing protease
MPQIEKDLTTSRDARGLIIDLRGNPGGIGGMAMGITGHLVDVAGRSSARCSCGSSLDFVINPQVVQFRGRVAVLIDEMSASTSEIPPEASRICIARASSGAPARAPRCHR